MRSREHSIFGFRGRKRNWRTATARDGCFADACRQSVFLAIFHPRFTPNASFIRAQAREDLGRAARRRPARRNASPLAGTGTVMDGRRDSTLKVLFQKHRGMRELMSSRMSSHWNWFDALEVEIAALGEVEEHGIDERHETTDREHAEVVQPFTAQLRVDVKGWRPAE